LDTLIKLIGANEEVKNEHRKRVKGIIKFKRKLLKIFSIKWTDLEKI
jgi:hypothetical protein